MFEIMLFFAGSLILFWISRDAIRTTGSHGFYRFFAWEAILGLVLLNGSSWLVKPLAFHQIISWILLLCSIPLVVWGVTALRTGKSAEERDDTTLLEFEKTTALVTDGIYQYIRHPLYSSLLFLTWGIFFKDISWAGFALGVMASVLLFLTAKADERECVRYFGAAYSDYMQGTKRFIPYVF